MLEYNIYLVFLMGLLEDPCVFNLRFLPPSQGPDVQHKLSKLLMN